MPAHSDTMGLCIGVYVCVMCVYMCVYAPFDHMVCVRNINGLNCSCCIHIVSHSQSNSDFMGALLASMGMGHTWCTDIPASKTPIDIKLKCFKIHKTPFT